MSPPYAIFAASFLPYLAALPAALGAPWAGAAYGLYSGVAALMQTHLPSSLALPWPVVVQPLAPWMAAGLWLLSEASVIRSARFQVVPVEPVEAAEQELRGA